MHEPEVRDLGRKQSRVDVETGTFSPRLLGSLTRIMRGLLMVLLSYLLLNLLTEKV
jgi:hypothetical protein